MATALRPIGHEDRLTLVDHLDELRSRLIICVIALSVSFALCFWQANAILHIINKPLEETTHQSAGGGQLSAEAATQRNLRIISTRLSAAVATISKASKLPPADRAAVAADLAIVQKSIAALPTTLPKREPVTLGVGEPFFVTLTVAGYAAILFALPIILYQLYGFILPAFTPDEKRVALPLMSMIPVLFILGVIFGYFVVLPPAIRFLQNFNHESFDILVQAKDYYRFAAMTLLSMGLVFQVPVGILALTRVGIVTPRQLRKNRRYAIVVNAVIAMLLPGTDPVTMLLCMAPLVVLYELSILLASAVDRRTSRFSTEEELILADDDPDD